MKRLYTIIFLLFGFANVMFAQKEEWTTEKEKFPYLKEKYELTVDKPFDEVWQASLKSIEELNCMIINKSSKQDDNGLYKGKVESDFCVFAEGDSVWQNFKYYATEPPFIRGGVWKTGRFQYKIIVKEEENGQTYIRVMGEVSGHETHVTNKVQFFQSNGFKETMMIERIKKNLGLPYEFKEG